MRLRKSIAPVCLSAVVFLSGCGGSSSSVASSAPAEAVSEVASSVSESQIASAPEPEETFAQVSFTVHSDFVTDGTSQAGLDRRVSSTDGLIAATLNEDGSVTYITTQAYYDDMCAQLHATYASAVQSLVGSSDYPDIVDIQYNDDFTDFTVMINSSTLSDNTGFSATMQLLMYGSAYGAEIGSWADNVRIEYISAVSGNSLYVYDTADFAG